jgi:hypothetical protein
MGYETRIRQLESLVRLIHEAAACCIDIASGAVPRSVASTDGERSGWSGAFPPHIASTVRQVESLLADETTLSLAEAMASVMGDLTSAQLAAERELERIRTKGG